MIRTDCYLAVLNKFRETFPSAHFEVITLRSGSSLAPSKALLQKAGIFKLNDGSINPKMDFAEYRERFTREIENNPLAQERLEYLANISEVSDVFLVVCYEKDPLECYRTIVRDLLVQKILERTDIRQLIKETCKRSKK